MQIRAITLGIPAPFTPDAIQAAGTILTDARGRFEAAGFGVQTLRLTTPAIDTVAASPDEVGRIAADLVTALEGTGIDYAALGPAWLDSAEADITWVTAIVDALIAQPSLFGSVAIGRAGAGVSIRAARACAEAVSRIASSTNQGFGNLRFAVQANCPPGGPFFPTGYSDGGPPSLALALESADLAVEAFAAPSLEEARAALLASLESVGDRLVAIAESMGVRFGGIDLSLAPYPEQSRSIGAALERLGLAGFGGPGTLAACAFLADILRSARLPRRGFSGLMLPVLEDSSLAASFDVGRLTIDQLMLYSAVCGTGIDTVPLAGDVTVDQIAGILMDIAALAVVLDKPLTARLFPVPGLRAGDRTAFDFEYFVNARVQTPNAAGPARALAMSGWLPLQPLHRAGTGG